MCIGIPGQICAIDGVLAKVEVCGIQRDVDLTLVEAEARDTLEALQNMFDVEPDVGALLYGEER